jgi:hypothetical protein
VSGASVSSKIDRGRGTSDERRSERRRTGRALRGRGGRRLASHRNAAWGPHLHPWIIPLRAAVTHRRSLTRLFRPLARGGSPTCGEPFLRLRRASVCYREGRLMSTTSPWSTRPALTAAAKAHDGAGPPYPQPPTRGAVLSLRRGSVCYMRITLTRGAVLSLRRGSVCYMRITRAVPSIFLARVVQQVRAQAGGVR